MNARMKRRQLGAAGHGEAPTGHDMHVTGLGAGGHAVTPTGYDISALSFTDLSESAPGDIRLGMSNVSLMSEVEDLKARLASTATQLTTTEDELRQKVELEGSLLFAVDVLRTRLDMQTPPKNGKGNKPSHRGGAATVTDGEVESVQELLSELGLTGVSPRTGAASNSRDIEDSELRIEGLESRLAKSEQARRQAEDRLAEREVTIQSLQSKIDSLRTRLANSERRGAAEMARLTEQLVAFDRSEKKMKDELDQFKTQLAVVAEIKVTPDAKQQQHHGPVQTPGIDVRDEERTPFDEMGNSRRNYQYETPTHAAATITPDQRQLSASDAEKLEARAKAKVLLSLKKEADFSYQGAINDLETMIAHVYKKEVRSELKANRDQDDPPNGRALEQLHDISTQRLDQVSDDFKKLLGARDKMMKLHAKIQKQCDAILAMTDTTNEMESGIWAVSPVHPVLPGAC